MKQIILAEKKKHFFSFVNKKNATELLIALRFFIRFAPNSPRVRIIDAIIVVLSKRFFVREITFALEPSARWCLVVVESRLRFAEQSIGFFDLFTIFASDDRFAGDGIDDIAQFVHDFLNLMRD